MCLQALLCGNGADAAAQHLNTQQALLQSVPHTLHTRIAADTLRPHCYRACYIVSLVTISRLTSEKQTEKEAPAQA